MGDKDPRSAGIRRSGGLLTKGEHPRLPNGRRLSTRETDGARQSGKRFPLEHARGRGKIKKGAGPFRGRKRCEKIPAYL